MLWPRVKKHVNSKAATRNSTRVMLGLGGILSRIVGISDTKAIKSAAIEITLSPKFSVWKKIPKFRIAKSQRGKKIMAIESNGNL
jgi:hypothetical protein